MKVLLQITFLSTTLEYIIKNKTMKKTLLSLGKILDKSAQQTINGGINSSSCPGECTRYVGPGIIICVPCGKEEPPKK